MTRQQRVITAIREQAMGWNLPFKLPGLVGTALESVATNLSASEILKLSYWLVRLDGDRIRQIVLTAPGKMIQGKAVVVADEATLTDAVTKLLTPPDSDSEETTTTATEVSTTTTTTTFYGGISAGTPSGWPDTSSTTVPPSTTTSTLAPGDFPDGALWRFALEAPRFIPVGFKYTGSMPTGGGTYQIEPGGKSKPAVRMLYRYKTKDLYLGTSAKVDHIWWKKDGVLSFISNTLMYTASKEDLLNMAVSMAPLDSPSGLTPAVSSPTVSAR